MKKLTGLYGTFLRGFIAVLFITALMGVGATSAYSASSVTLKTGPLFWGLTESVGIAVHNGLPYTLNANATIHYVGTGGDTLVVEEFIIEPGTTSS